MSKNVIPRNIIHENIITKNAISYLKTNTRKKLLYPKIKIKFF